MCGIHLVLHSSAKKNDRGVLGRSSGYNEFMKDGFVTGMVRGTDSSGVFQVDCKGKAWVSKMPLPGLYFATDSSASGILGDVDDCPITVGHVRAATSGKINADNAHPFSSKPRPDGSYIIGVHNGSLNYWKFDPEAKDYDVDSEWAINLIAKEGADAFGSIEGAYSFVWWDSRTPDHVFFARNDQRPMLLLRSLDGKSILAASEAGMLSWLADRASLNVETDVYSTEPGRMYRIDTSKPELLLEDLGHLPEMWDSRKRSTVMTPAPLGNPVLKNNDVAGWDAAMERMRGDSRANYLDDDWGMGAAEADLDTKRREDTIAAVKAALALGRARVIEGIATPLALVDYTPEDDEAEYGADAWMNPMFQPPSDWFSNENTTEEERQAAWSDGSYGVMVTYQPVAFDDANSEVVGEILEPGDTKNALAYIRGQGIIEYTEELKDRMVQAVIVGVAGVVNGEREYIVSPLTEKGEKGIIALAA
jgi:hypothetical protein